MNEYDELIARARGGNEYDAGIQAEQSSRLGASLKVAVGTNPDEYAKAARLAKATGAPAEIVARNLPEVEQAARINEYDALLRDAPVARQQMTRPDFAKVAHDDIAGMGLLEKSIGAVKRGWIGLQQAGSATALGANARALQGLDALEKRLTGGENPALIPDAADTMGARWLPVAERAALRARLSGAVTGTATSVARLEGERRAIPQDATVAAAMSAKSFGEFWQAFKQKPVEFIATVGAESLPQMLPGLAAAIPAGIVAGPVGAAAAMGAGSFGVDYASTVVDAMRSEGVDVANPLAIQTAVADEALMQRVGRRAYAHAAVVGAFDALSGGVAAKPLVGASVVRNATARQAANVAVQAPVQGALGAAGEAGGQVASGEGLQAGSIAAEFFGEFVGTPAEVATMAAGRLRNRTQAAEQAQGVNPQLKALHEAAASSKLKQRSPEAFGEFVEAAAADGPVQDVFVDGRQLAEVLNQGGIEPDQVPASVREQLTAAVQTGGDVRIPLAEYAATLAGTDAGAALLPHLRTAPEAMSAAEADAFMQSRAAEFQRAAEQVVSESQSRDAMRESAAQVERTILDQLNGAGRFTPDVNAAYAAMLRDFYTVQAGRLGIAPQQMFERYPLRVAAESVAGAQALDQAPIARVVGDELGTDLSPENAVERARAYYRSNLQGQPVTREGFGTVQFTGKGWGKLKNGLKVDADKLRLIPAIRSIIEHGDYGGREALNKERSDGVVAFHFFTAPIDLGGRVLKAAVSVAEDANGNLFYNLNRDPDALIAKKAGGGNPMPGGSVAGSATQNPAESPYPGVETRPPADVGNPDTLEQSVAPSDEAINLDVLEQPARASITAGTAGTGQPTVISLFKGADLSSVLHEGGHLYLEIFADLASREDAPAEIRADMQRVLDWFGVKGDENRSALDEWNAMTLEQKRPHHEQFARGFEAYALEGRAPSLALQPFFARFRAWLLRVYQSAKALNVELTGEVRGVFDRMLATENEIRAAEAARSYAPLFATAEQAGMTADEFADYQRLGESATQDAIAELQARGLRDMQWLGNARGKVMRELQRDAADKRKAMRREVEAQVRAEPVYAAQHWLRRGDMIGPDGEQVKAEKGFRLDTTALAEMYPESMLGRPDVDALRGMKAKGGLHPDMVADMFGFSSGDELVRTILDAPPEREVVESRTDQRMIEAYGDLNSAEAIERAADEAVHNEMRARAVAAEYAALDASQPRMDAGTDKRGRRRTGDVLLKAAKEYAAQIVATKRVRDLHVAQFTAAESRAARAADAAMRKGDVATAATEKRNQLLNGQTARAAMDATREIERARKYLAKFDHGNSRKSLPADYLDQIDALLERTDLRKSQSLKAIDRRKSLADWIEAQRESGIEPDIDARTIEEASRQSYKDMTVEQLRGLVDAVKQIEHLGRQSKKLLTAKRQVEFEAVRDEMAASIREHAKGREADTRTPVTRLGRALQSVKRFGAAHIKAATWARILDGGKAGPVWEYLMRSANEAGDRETTMRAEATQRLSAILAPVFKLGSMGGKGQFFAGINRSLNRQQRIAIALNSGNASNMQRLLGGEGWTPEQVRPVLDSLTKVEWDAVQAVWDHFEQYRPMIAEKERRLLGKEPAWIEPVPVETPHGTYRGGYYPVRFDPAASQRAEEHADAEDARRQMQGAYTSATTRRSFTKARAEEVVGRPLLYTLSGVYQGTNEVIHDLTWHEWLIDANRLLKSNAVDSAIREHYGPHVKEQFKTWVAAVAEGERGSSDAIDVAIARLRQGVSAAGLGFNVMSALQQPLGLTQSIVRIGAAPVARGIAQYMAHPIRLTRQVDAQSEFMRNRQRTRFRELNELRNQVEGQSTAMQKVHGSTYWLLMRLQQVVDVTTWQGAFERYTAEGNDEARAVALADQAVIDAQGSGMQKDLSAIERGGPAQKLFTVFYSFFNSSLNLGVASTATASSKAQAAVNLLLLYTVPAILGQAIKIALTGDEDDWEPDELAKKLGGAQIDYLMGLMVGLREFTEAAKIVSGTSEYQRDYAGPAGLRPIADTVALAKQVHQGEFDTAFRKALINVIGDFTGLPSAQANRTITGIEALSEGKTDNPAAVIFGYSEPR